MQAIKTKAVVNEEGQLDLLKADLNLQKGDLVEVIILLENSPAKPSDWKKVLKSMRTYTDAQLSGFVEAKREIDRWQPKEY